MPETVMPIVVYTCPECDALVQLPSDHSIDDLIDALATHYDEAGHNGG